MLTLSVPRDIYADLQFHLAPRDVEMAAFLFTEPVGDSGTLRVVESFLVPAEGFVIQSAAHIELTDAVRQRVLKRASELGGGLAEVHSHCGATSAAFSRSDLLGFTEWVPHVRWRLRGRPYIALVFAGADFDALVWTRDDGTPDPLAALAVDDDENRPPSGVTYRRLPRGHR